MQYLFKIVFNAMSPFVVSIACLSLVLIYGEARAEGEARLVAVPWYVLSQEGGGLGLHVDDTVVASSVQVEADGQHQFWIAERLNLRTSLADKGALPVHQWIDGRNCTALGDILSKAPALFVSRPASGTANLRIAPPSEIARLKLSAPSAGEVGQGGGRTSISEYFGPLARWWAAGSAKLENCWTDRSVDLAGRPTQSLLGNLGEASRWKTF